MGCGIACVACALNKSYKTTKKLSKNPEYAVTRGYYCREIVDTLNKNGLSYSFSRANNKNKKILNRIATIVFIGRNKNYPLGHYLVKTEKGWMNPWMNFPNIAPAKAGFQKKLLGEPQWIIYAKL